MSDTLLEINLDHDNILEVLDRLINEDEKEKVSIRNLDYNQLWVLIEKISRRVLGNKSKFNISEIEKELKKVNKEYQNESPTLNTKRARDVEEPDDDVEEDEDLGDTQEDALADDEVIEDEEDDFDADQDQDKANKRKDKFFSMQELNKIANEDLEDEEILDEEGEEIEEIDEDDGKKARFEDFFDDPNAPEDGKEEDNFEDEDIEDNIFEQEQRYIDQGNNFINGRTVEQINEIEEKMMKDKPWNMKGEIKANHRPKESLLENPVDFQVTNKPPPIPDSNYTEAIENLIRLRIKDDLFDDPVRKVPIDNKNKERFELNFQKSKKGLGEIYEEEYTGEQATESEVTGVKKEIDDLTSSLYAIFDKLTNNNFVSTVTKSEMKLTSNIPAIQLEDISNYVTDNKATTKSAGELFNLKEAKFKTREELTKEERNTEHNKWKRNVRNKLREKQRNKKLKEISKVADSKFEAKLMMKQAKDKVKKNVKNSELKSTKFFTNLQTIATEDKNKNMSKREDSNDFNTKQAKKFKL